MRIAMILPSLANKGPIIVARDLCRGLVGKGHTCKIYYFDDIVELDMPCDTEQISFWRKIDFRKYDIVHSHMFRPDAYVFYRKPLFPVHTKFVTTLHQHLREQLPYDNPSAFKVASCIHAWLFFLRRFDGIVTLSKYHEHYYKVENHLRNVSVIFNGREVDTSIDIDETDRECVKEFKSRYKVIGAIAYITSRKGYEQIIQALAFLPEYGILFVGDGPEVENLKTLSRKLGVSQRCLWLGKRKAGYRYLKYIDFFALCSRTEGFPLSLIEALAFAKPTVCSDIQVFSSVISEHETSFFELDDIESLVEAIRKMDVNKELYSCAAKAYYRKFLTPEVMIANYLSLYQSLLS